MFKRLCMAVMALTVIATPTQAASMRSIIDSITSPRFTEHIVEDTQETLCLALNVYHEARGSTRSDQAGVAWVTKNRMARSGHSYCRTIWAPGQFTWTVRSSSSLIPREMAAWRRSVEVARQVMAGALPDPTRGARNFRVARLGGGSGYRVIGAHAYW